LLTVVGSYNTLTDNPVTKVLESGKKFVTGEYAGGAMGAFECGMYAGPFGCDTSRFERAQLDVLAHQKKKGFDSTRTAKHPK